MNLNHLAVFHAVAQEKSITAAARRLLISQPAVSKQLGQLERKLRVKLFDRQPRGVQPTEAGICLASYAARLFTLADDSERAMDELRGLHRGRLRIGASTTIGVYLLPDVFVGFRKAHPNIQLHLEIAPSELLQERLLNGSIDLAVTEGNVRDESLKSTVLMDDQLITIAPFNHPLTRKRSVTASTLCREPFVIRETGSGTQSLVELSLAQRGLHINPAMSLGSTEAIKRAVASGVGVAIVSRLAVELELHAKKLALVRISDLDIRRPVHCVTHRNATPSQSASAFLAMLQKVIRAA